MYAMHAMYATYLYIIPIRASRCTQRQCGLYACCSDGRCACDGIECGWTGFVETPGLDMYVYVYVCVHVMCWIVYTCTHMHVSVLIVFAVCMCMLHRMHTTLGAGFQQHPFDSHCC